MEAERWQRARKLFETLADVPAVQWPDRLLELCPDDGEVRGEALDLLLADAQARTESALGIDAAPALVGAIAEEHEQNVIAQLTGSRVGAYRLVRELGRGGMGQVWLAERADGEFAQRVAIKLLRTGWDADEVLARFKAERQILAGLSHPNIAHLIDGGVTADGKPWLALEYIDGVGLREHCNAQRLSLDARLPLFLTVCEAVAYAHARLIVHRDLKPSNLMVDGAGQVKLLDFGIAKLLDADAATSATRAFTPEYAAPEQVRGEMVTTSVDVYALGLLLYELLSGRRAYRLDHSTPAAYERAILDQEPTRPSLAATGTDANALARAQERHLTPALLRRELRGDLDAIVMKALRKQPAQRYASVADFAADIDNYLHHRPVLARRGNWRYRAQRFLQRHALAVALACGIAVAVVTGLGLALWQRGIALRERDRAEVEAESARRVVAFLQQVFEKANPSVREGEVVTVQQLLDEGERSIAADLAEQPQIRAALLETLGAARSGVGDPVRAIALARQALALREPFGDAVAKAGLHARLAQFLNMSDQFEEALKEAGIARAMSAGDSRAAREIHAEATYQLGMIDVNLHRREESIAVLRDALEQFRQLYGSDSRQFASALRPLAYRLGWNDRAEEAFALVDPAWRDLAAKIPPNDPRRQPLLDIEAEILKKLGRYDEALGLMREANTIELKIYGEDHRLYLATLQNYATALYASGHYDEAADIAAKLIAWRRQHPQVPLNPRMDYALEVYAKALDFAGHSAQAIPVLEEELAIARKVSPADPDSVVGALFWLAHALRRAGRLDDAARRLEELDAAVKAHPQSDVDFDDIDIERTLLAIDSPQRPLDCAPAQHAATSRAKGNVNNKAIADAALALCLMAAGRRQEAAPVMPGLSALQQQGRMQALARQTVALAVARWQAH